MHSITPGSDSRTPKSTAPLFPVIPIAVRIVPGMGCAFSPKLSMRSHTPRICSSVACDCMTTSISGSPRLSVDYVQPRSLRQVAAKPQIRERFEFYERELLRQDSPPCASADKIRAVARVKAARSAQSSQRTKLPRPRRHRRHTSEFQTNSTSRPSALARRPRESSRCGTPQKHFETAGSSKEKRHKLRAVWREHNPPPSWPLSTKSFLHFVSCRATVPVTKFPQAPRSRRSDPRFRSPVQRRPLFGKPVLARCLRDSA